MVEQSILINHVIFYYLLIIQFNKVLFVTVILV